MITKTCTRCGVVKALVEFYPRADRASGRRSVCRVCEIARVSAHKARDPAKNSAARRARRHTYKEQVRAGEAGTRQRGRMTLVGYLAQAAVTKRKVCKREGMECEITGEFLLSLFEKQNGLCKLSGHALVWGPGPREPDTLSIDRIDHGLGYLQTNVRLVTCQANMARGNLDDAALVALARDIVRVADENETGSAPPAHAGGPREVLQYPVRHAEDCAVLHYRVHEGCRGVSAGGVEYTSRPALIDAVRNGRRVRIKALVVEVPVRLAKEMESLSLPRVQVVEE